MSSLELQFRQYQRQQRGEYRLAKHQPRKPIGAPYEPNRIIVVGNDFAQRCREYYGEEDMPRQTSLKNEPFLLDSDDIALLEENGIAVPLEDKRKLTRAKRRRTEARRLEWSLKK